MNSTAVIIFIADYLKCTNSGLERCVPVLRLDDTLTDLNYAAIGGMTLGYTSSLRLTVTFARLHRSAVVRHRKRYLVAIGGCCYHLDCKDSHSCGESVSVQVAGTFSLDLLS